MPFDGQKFQETKADALDLRGFVSWLEHQNPNETYRFLDACGCALGQYLTSHGWARPDICGPARWAFEGSIAYVTARLPSTFGAALDRARELLAERQP